MIRAFATVCSMYILVLQVTSNGFRSRNSTVLLLPTVYTEHELVGGENPHPPKKNMAGSRD